MAINPVGFFNFGGGPACFRQPRDQGDQERWCIGKISFWESRFESGCDSDLKKLGIYVPGAGNKPEKGDETLSKRVRPWVAVPAVRVVRGTRNPRPGYCPNHGPARSKTMLHQSLRNTSPPMSLWGQWQYRPDDSSALPDNPGHRMAVEEQRANNSTCLRRTPDTWAIPLGYRWAAKHPIHWPIEWQKDRYGRHNPHTPRGRPTAQKTGNNPRKSSPTWVGTRSGLFCSRWEPWCPLRKTQEIATHLIYTGAIRTIQQNCSPRLR